MIVSTRFFRIIRAIEILTLLFLSFSADVTPASAATIMVNTTNDEVINDSKCSLREAIESARNGIDYFGCKYESTRNITLPTGIYTIGSRLPSITESITITGTDANPTETIIQASNCNPTTNRCSQDYELFYVNDATLNLYNLTIRHAQSFDKFGGAIFNDEGVLNIQNCLLTSNRSWRGGAIANFGSLYIGYSLFSSNTAGDYYNAGAIFNEALHHTYIFTSTFSDNSADMGGAIENKGVLEITNSTFSGNNAVSRGGAIYSSFDIKVVNSTFSGNAATMGGAGIWNNNGTMILSNTIIANSTTGSECVNDGQMLANLNNLIEDMSCAPDYSGDPLLGPLADNGGFTQTHALQPSSPAIDNGNLAVCPGVDQRGVSRPQPEGGGCDIGAFEMEYPLIFLPAIFN